MKLDIPPNAYPPITVAITITIVFGFFKQSGFFTRGQRVHPRLSLAELTKKYRWWEAFCIVPFFVFAAASTYALHGGLEFLSKILRPASPEILFIAAPDVAWWIPSMFMGMVLSVVPLTLFLKLLLGGEKYQEFECYSDMKAGFNTNRAFGFIGVVVVGLSIAGSAALFNFYWRFDHDGFAINPFLELKERRYTYSDVKELRLVSKFRAPNGDLKNKPYYELVTKDGEHWKTRTGPCDDMAVLKPLFTKLSQKSGVRITHHELSPKDTSR